MRVIYAVLRKSATELMPDGFCGDLAPETNVVEAMLLLARAALESLGYQITYEVKDEEGEEPTTSPTNGFIEVWEDEEEDRS